MQLEWSKTNQDSQISQPHIFEAGRAPYSQQGAKESITRDNAAEASGHQGPKEKTRPECQAYGKQDPVVMDTKPSTRVRSIVTSNVPMPIRKSSNLPQLGGKATPGSGQKPQCSQAGGTEAQTAALPIKPVVVQAQLGRSRA